MKKRLISLSTIIASLLAISFVTQAKPISIGMGISATDSPYKGYGEVYYPLPSILFDNGVFFINNFTAGAYLYNQDNHKFSLGLSYLPLEFKPKDSDDSQMKQLNKRRSTLLAEARYSITTPIGAFAAGIGGDILDESNSIIIGANYSYMIADNNWSIVPKIGFMWANDKHNDYYYGVSHSESLRSGLAYHDAKSSFTPYISLVGNYALTEELSSYAGIRVDKLTGDAKNSPIIANSIITSLFAGINYTF